ncbi:LPS export ABC transporter permease LptF [Roseicyclus persicicus]|uniref:LPS export ABC transporter permease LptF n=1 Tax=Roseicyclus persicicus TaxID=2650661 RepID=A0A7X6GYH2_9RHOB|nr:LPS export ABC transporter permease LptF [Roseibacterium persicicum]NKX44739.1 LPS export ABC transporter permease LptF [Roseibacterium persicicum]
MGRYDRYILSQLIVLFGFFSLVLISVYWINEAVDLFDSLIADGQTLSVFLEFTALTLPQIMLLVLPVAAFVATLYIFNRMIGESEMVVLQTAGLSAARLLRPVLVFGLTVGLLIAVLGNLLAPIARTQFIDRSQEVQEDLTGRFLREGQFIHPTEGLTVYIRDITELGEFRDLFLQDRSDPRAETTYTATRALLVRSDTGPRLVMFDGLAQTLNLSTQRLATVRFDDFTYDIGALIGDGGFRSYDLRELPTWVLITADAQVAEQLNLSLPQMRFAGHDRIARALFVIFPPLIAAACLMLGGFSRFGVWPQIMLAVGLVIPLQMIWNVAETAAIRDASLSYLAYLQPAMAAAMAGVLTWGAMRRRRRRRDRADGAVPA